MKSKNKLKQELAEDSVRAITLQKHAHLTRGEGERKTDVASDTSEVKKIKNSKCVKLRSISSIF